jgi:predicted O-methyltransferase YrrM
MSTNPTNYLIDDAGNIFQLVPTDKKQVLDTLNPEPQYEFSEDWFTFHIPHWDETLRIMGKTRTDPLRILEIGCYEGRSSTWISDNLLTHPDSSMWCIDTFEGSIEHEGQENLHKLLNTFYSNIAQSKNFRKMRVVVNDSKQVMPLMIKNGMKFDLIYVDGSHETHDVIQDGVNAFNLLADGGAIIFDDYWWKFQETHPVKDACDVLETMIPIIPSWSTWQRTYTVSK